MQLQLQSQSLIPTEVNEEYSGASPQAKPIKIQKTVKTYQKRTKGSEQQEFLRLKTDQAIRKLTGMQAAQDYPSMKLSHIASLVQKAQKVKDEEKREISRWGHIDHKLSKCAYCQT